MIAVTRFIGRDPPSLDAPELLELGDIVLCCGAFPHDADKIGNLPLSPSERAHPFAVGTGRPGPDGVISGFPLVGPIQPVGFGRDAWRDWRWRNERTAMQAEMAEARAEDQRRIAERVHAPREPMASDAFWELIAQLDWDKTGDDDAVVAPLVTALARRGVADIKAFAETLAHMLYLLDTQRHAEQTGESAWKGEETFFSVDSFLYARCAAVASGRTVFERALAHSRHMPKDVEFEPLLYVAGAAYQKRTRKEWDHQTGCSYETFSNRKGWAQPAGHTGGAAPPRSSH